MTIDLTAAISSVNSSVGEASGVHPAGSGSGGLVQDWTKGTRATDVAAHANLFDHALQQQVRPQAPEIQRPERKTAYLSNPAALGEQVLQRLEGLHDRSTNFQTEPSAAVSAPTAADAGQPVMAGPASSHVAGTANTAPDRSVEQLDWLLEQDLQR